MEVLIRGKRWQLIFTKSIPKDCDGCCDAPTAKSKTIRIRQSLRGREALETIIHECSHAGHWDLSEEAIAEMSHDLAKVLYRLGYRRLYEN